jgi:hypothetical protein
VKEAVVNDTCLAAWKLPLIVGAIATSIVAGFYLGGPGLGMAVGGLAAGSIVVMAVRHPPLYPIVPAQAPDLRRRLLVVVAEPLEDPEAIELIAAAARGGECEGEPREPEILVVTPVRHRFLDRWASDFDRGRERAQRALVLSLASLAGAELSASARVGEEDLVQAVEDALRSFPATEVVLVTGSSQQDAAARAAGAELELRLRVPLHHLCQAAGDGRRTAQQRSPLKL